MVHLPYRKREYTEDDREQFSPKAEVQSDQAVRKVLGFEKYKKLRRDGYVPVRGRSGRLYLVTYGIHHMAVYSRNGKLTDSLCLAYGQGSGLNLKFRYPPSAQFLLKYTMLLSNERRFLSLCKKHGADDITMKELDYRRNLRLYRSCSDIRPLTQVVADIKAMPRRRNNRWGFPTEYDWERYAMGVDDV